MGRNPMTTPPDHIPPETPAFREDQLSQIPALHLLQNLGYRYLLPAEALRLRGERESQVLLLDVLADQLRRINRVRHRGQEQPFTEGAIAEAVRQLRDLDDGAGLVQTNRAAWDLIRFGVTQPQTIGGDTRSFPLHYVDWEHPENNVFHVTDEFAVTRAGRDDTYRPDIVLFVNGIPFAVVECKRPGMRDALGEAVSQQVRNQKADGIPQLYHYAQAVFAVAMNEASYGAAGTAARFYSRWKERPGGEDALPALVSRPLDAGQLDQFFTHDPARFHGLYPRGVRAWFEATQQHGRSVTEQDRLLHALARPDRLLELARRFTVFDAGERKLARYQQYFCVQRAMERLRTFEPDGTRRGGVVWHTQGSGKSITMVMLAEALREAHDIPDARIVLVTDRVDLDEQIYGNFVRCGVKLTRASTGSHLMELLRESRTQIITTLVHKFEAALNARGAEKLDDPDVFVLVDESHRTQFGSFHAQMKRTLPRACFLGFTGTPVMKQDRSTLERFGGLIDTYTIDDAVADGAVVPLLYEGRLVQQDVDQVPIDQWFERYTRGLSEDQVADLKRKFTTAGQLGRTERTIQRTAWDISEHFSRTFGGTGFKGQLVTPSKADALLYKKYLDEFGLVTSEVLISPPDDREGHEEVEEIRDGADRPSVNDFWRRMMSRFGDESNYQKALISAFKGPEEPEIIIVVDKLLVGFDAPRNAVLYLARKLDGHNLLQAIARVNRLYEGKDHGLIVDYRGVLRRLGEALDLYQSFGEQYDAADIAHAVRDISEETRRLPQRHSDVWDLFRSVRNKHDAEAMEQALEPDELRETFYERLGLFARTLQVALSSAEFLDHAQPEKLDRWRRDLKYFMALRASVQRRYAEAVDFKQYQTRIQKLLDTHVGAGEVEIVVDAVSIFDREAFQREIDQLESPASKAHTIANRVKRAITVHMSEDPVFYERFSKLLQDAIDRFRQERLDDAGFLAEVENIRDRVRDHTDDDVPEPLRHHVVARAYFGVLYRRMQEIGAGRDDVAELALRVDRIIEGLRIVHWTQNADQVNRMRRELDDELFAFRTAHHVMMDYSLMDDLIEALINIARAQRP
ncbi:MAG: type I restriction endonuclease subunit R [Candidatus Eisenbacteria bacterium]